MKNLETGGAGTGCLILVALFCGALLLCPGSVSVPVVSDLVAADRERAAANHADADANKTNADANKTDADAAKVVADANAYAVRRYTDAGVNAIETDRKEAHKMIWLTEIVTGWLAWTPLLCCFPLNLVCLVAALVMWRKQSST